MREKFGQIAFAISILINAIAEVCIAVVANMLAIHALMLTRKFLPTLVTPKIAVVTVTVAHFLLTLITVMLGRVLMRAVDDSVATIAIVILVFVLVVANKFPVACGLVTVSVVIIVVAPNGNPNATPVAGVIPFIVLVVVCPGIFSTLGFLAADVANRVSVLVDMVIASQLRTTFVANPIAVSIYAHVRHPCATLITEVILVLVNVLLSNLLHAVCRAITLITSSVIIPVRAVVAQPQTAMIA